MRKAFAAAALVVLALSGCASSSSSAGDEKSASSVNVTEPDVQLTQLSTVAEAARHVTGGIPVQYRVEVTNNAADTIKLNRVTLQSIGAGAYTLPNTSRPAALEVAPNSTKSIDFWTSAVVESDTVFGSNGPVSIRVTAFFDSPKGSFTKTVVEQVHYTPTQGQ